jgi:hypothetical protein
MGVHRVNCLIQKNDNALTVSVAPFLREVKDKKPTVIWDANGDGLFPDRDFFSWKTGGPGSIPVRSPDGKTLTLDYEQASPSNWTYMIRLQAGEAVVTIDPDIHNDPPAGGGGGNGDGDGDDQQ